MGGNGRRKRSGEVLFIDARNLGYMKDRVLRDFAEADIEKITEAFHSWQGQVVSSQLTGGAKSRATDNQQLTTDHSYCDVPGFCKSATLDEIAKHDFVLTPGRYVGAEEEEEDAVSFELRFAQLNAELRNQMTQARQLDERIEENLNRLASAD